MAAVGGLSNRSEAVAISGHDPPCAVNRRDFYFTRCCCTHTNVYCGRDAFLHSFVRFCEVAEFRRCSIVHVLWPALQ